MVDEPSTTKFKFDAVTFVRQGYETDPGEWSNETQLEIAKLREAYPELTHWGDLAIGLAFGEFSQDVLEVSWADWMVGKRDEIFLNYCCWRQTRGGWKHGFDEASMAVANDWKSLCRPSPSN